MDYDMEDWLDDMARIEGIQVWDSERGFWIWEDTGEPVNNCMSEYDGE